MPPIPRAPAAELRTLQFIWSALAAGVALATGVLGGLTFAGYGRAVTTHQEALFFANAALNMAAVVAAFAIQGRMMARLRAGGTRAEVVAAARSAGVPALGLLEASALVAGGVALLTGEWVNLLFVAPFFGFALLFFPTAGRLDALRNAEPGGK